MFMHMKTKRHLFHTLVDDKYLSLIHSDVPTVIVMESMFKWQMQIRRQTSAEIASAKRSEYALFLRPN